MPARTAKQYRQRAAEVRTEAERLTTPEAKQTLLDVAAGYEHLANAIDAHANHPGFIYGVIGRG
jgi:hypothetical protein